MHACDKIMPKFRGVNNLGKERKNLPSDTDELLNEADRGMEVETDRIHQTLRIDGETHPSREKVAKEVCRLHARKSKRKHTSRKQSP